VSRSLRGWRPPRSDRTPAGRCAFRPRSTASRGSRPRAR
jgi:hypothetical protein